MLYISFSTTQSGIAITCTMLWPKVLYFLHWLQIKHNESKKNGTYYSFKHSLRIFGQMLLEKKN